jgi:hypothetical protein
LDNAVQLSSIPTALGLQGHNQMGWTRAGVSGAQPDGVDWGWGVVKAA